MKLTTPSAISPNIKQFLKAIGLSKQPQYLKFTYALPDYKASYCLDNCELEQKRTGCQIVYGWIIWADIKQTCMVAEFHGVVKRQGVLIDITPRVDGEDKILFVQDGSRTPKRVNNYTWSSWSNFSALNGHIVWSESKNKKDFAKRWPLLKKILSLIVRRRKEQ